MAIIRKYGQYPQVFVPNLGEMVWARKVPGDKWCKAVVIIKPWRTRGGEVRLKVEWREDDPNASYDKRTCKPKGHKAGGRGSIAAHPDLLHTVVRPMNATRVRGDASN